MISPRCAAPASAVPGSSMKYVQPPSVIDNIRTPARFTATIMSLRRPQRRRQRAALIYKELCDMKTVNSPHHSFIEPRDRLLSACRFDERVHMVEILLERSSARRAETIFGARRAA